MTGTDPVREEAERLVAAALAAAQRALARGERFAAGGAECCVCPVCRAIAAVRDPSPEFVDRLATRAGDLAAGVAGLLRSFAGRSAPPGQRRAPDADRDGAGPGPAAEDVWAAATRAAEDGGPHDGGESQR